MGIIMQTAHVNAAVKPMIVSSPDKRIALTVSSDDGLAFSVTVDGKEVMTRSKIGMTIIGIDSS